MKMIVFVLMVLLTQVTLAQTQSPTQTANPPQNSLTQTAPEACPPPPACPTCPKCERGHTEVYRADSFGTLMYNWYYLNTWVPNQQGASYTQIFNRNWSLELEYAKSQRDIKIVGVELGKIQEERYTLLAKYYVGNSFHTSVGPYMMKYKMDTNDELRDRSGNRFSDTWELEGYGLATAFGNRWQTKWGITYGIDWIRMNIPLKIGKIKRRELNQEREDQAKRSFSILRTVPGFTFFGVSIGYTF